MRRVFLPCATHQLLNTAPSVRQYVNFAQALIPEAPGMLDAPKLRAAASSDGPGNMMPEIFNRNHAPVRPGCSYPSQALAPHWCAS